MWRVVLVSQRIVPTGWSACGLRAKVSGRRRRARLVTVLIGLDAGTSVVKAVAFDDDGDVLRVAAQPTQTIVPAPGRNEQDLEEVIAAAGTVIREVARGERVELLGITAQGDGLWLLDGTDARFGRRFSGLTRGPRQS